MELSLIYKEESRGVEGMKKIYYEIKLAPGEYRIGKSVLDFQKGGDYDEYTIYANFVLN